ncbi:MAG: VOC family protein [Pseudomonadota bacterium]
MRFLNLTIAVKNIEKSLDFYCNILGLIELSRETFQTKRYTIISLAAPDDAAWAKETSSLILRLRYDWDPDIVSDTMQALSISFEVEDIYKTYQKLLTHDINVIQPPKNGYRTLILSPENVTIELLQKDEPMPIMNI